MHDVMNKAQALAEAILNSDTYQTMHKMELMLPEDPEAASAMAEVVEKRNNVRSFLDDPEQLSKAAEELKKAQEKMDAIPIVSETQKAREAFDEMMNNINRILRLVITGQIEDETNGNCSGNCSACGGCH